MKDVKNLKIAYIGGGSLGWARNLMNDLAQEPDLGGKVYLYDIDKPAAEKNAKIGAIINKEEECKGKWDYIVAKDLKDALTGADFVFLSIMPGTFKEMRSDVHTPEKYGIYQSVGDTTGPGGIIRAMRTIPMYEFFAKEIEKHSPDAWVVNFTNPMTMCVRTLYKVFPKIKAFGCCHEVFGTQYLLSKVIKENYGIAPGRDEIVINVSGVNHFTWITQAKYRGMDLFPLYKKYIENHKNDKIENVSQGHWMNDVFYTQERVKFDLFNKYGAIAAAGDRHLAEFCPGKWYLESPEKVKEFEYALTTVDFREKKRDDLVKQSDEIIKEGKFSFYGSGEETKRQMKALLGLGNFVTNVNIPNVGQMDATLGAVVETNAYFSGDSVVPLMTDKLPKGAKILVDRIIAEQETVVEAVLEGDYEKVFSAFVNNPNVCLPLNKARELFNEMLYNTKDYLPHYDEYMKTQNKN